MMLVVPGCSLYLNVYSPADAARGNGSVAVLLWIYGGGFQLGGTATNTDGTPDVGSLDQPLVIVTVNYRLNVFGFAAADVLRDRDPAGGTGNYGLLDQRFAMRWVQHNIRSFGGDPRRVFIVGQSAGGESVSNHLVRPKSWGLFSAAGMESGSFYQLTIPGPYPVLPKDGNLALGCGPTPGNVTVREQAREWVAVMARLGCAATDVACAIRVPAQQLLAQGQLPGKCPWMPVIDGVDLTAPAADLAAEGKLPPGVPLLLGSNMEEGGEIPPKCASFDPGGCTETDLVLWAGEYGLNATESAQLARIYADEPVRTNLTAAGKPICAGAGCSYYWAMWHAGADEIATCSARRAARWATAAGHRAYWYYWEYPPREPHTGAPTPAIHCGELKFVWRLRCGANWTAGRPWAAQQCRFGLGIASFWQSFAANGDPAVTGPAAWPPFGAGSTNGGTALVVDDAMKLRVVANLRARRCDFWDAHSERVGRARAARRHRTSALAAAVEP